MKNKVYTRVFLLVAVGFLMTHYTSKAQSSLTIDASQMITNFDFINSAGEQVDSYNPLMAGAYHIGYRHELDMGVFFNANIGMRNAGATTVIDEDNYRWDLQYGQAKLGGGYGYDLGRLQPYLGLSFYYGFLLKANQRLNNENFDIIDSGAIEQSDYGLYFSPGIKFTLSDAVSAYSEVSYLMGLQNIETSTDGQEANNVAFSLTLGLAFTIQ